MADPKVISLRVHWVPERMPDADQDVIVFDSDDTVGQLGAYVGDDDDGPKWVNAHGMPIFNVTHWAELPDLRNAA